MAFQTIESAKGLTGEQVLKRIAEDPTSTEADEVFLKYYLGLFPTPTKVVCGMVYYSGVAAPVTLQEAARTILQVVENFRVNKNG